LSETVVGFKSKSTIAGGRGKYRNASGEFAFNGQFNVSDPNNAEYHSIGWIDY